MLLWTAVRRSQSQLISTFFGLTINTALHSRRNLFKQIHEIVFHGKGGYDWETIYNMPIWLRKFTFNEIKKFYEEEKKAAEGNTPPNQTNLVGPNGKVNTPEFAKASQQYKGKSSYK